jgi:hypothetical protein
MHNDTLRDILPEAPLSAPPSLPMPGLHSTDATILGVNAPPQTGADPPVTPPAIKLLDTPPNQFSVFQRYHAMDFPSHDPDAHVNLSMLSNIAMSTEAGISHDAAIPSPISAFQPYPNKSAFLLGEWYWAQGNQKSKKSFKALLDIVSNPNFSPIDIESTNWARIDHELAVNDWDKGEWVDEDAGWRRSMVKIQVPFHRNLTNPGPREYFVTNFYHHSLTSIIRKKLSKDLDIRHFHYEPYQLSWNPPHMKEEVRLYGELYTSPAFDAAQQDLQAAPSEPGYTLLRVVIALMFWSDATTLSNFGHVKLWPLYLFFGNESKYRRYKPSNNLCEHVAYFEEVHFSSFSPSVH